MVLDKIEMHIKKLLQELQTQLVHAFKVLMCDFIGLTNKRSAQSYTQFNRLIG